MRSPEETIRVAAKIDAMLKDDDIKDAFKAVSVRYYEEFRRAKSSEERVTAWAKANALEDVLTQLRVGIDAGEAAVLTAVKQRADHPRT